MSASITITLTATYPELDVAAGDNAITLVLTPALRASRAWGDMTGDIADQTDLQAALDAKEDAANKDASGGYAGLTLFKLNLLNTLGTITSWFTTAATAARTWTMPDKDGTVAMTSDIDAAVVGLWDDRGNYDASVNTFPASGGSGAAGAIVKGDIWTISVAGTLGGVPVATRQTVRALVDTPAQTAANWAIGLANTDVDDSITDGVTGRAPSQNAVFDALALNVPTSRTVNGHALSADVTVTAADVGAPSGSGSSTGTNTGDETGARLATLHHAASAKSAIVDADEVTGGDSEAGFGLIRTTWTSIKAFLKTYFDTLYVPVARTVNGQPLSADVTISTITGNAGTATALATARRINGKLFDGTADISTLNRTAVKTSNYTAAANDLVPCDTTSGSFTVTLPTAPANGTEVEVKQVIRGGSNTVTVACAGSDVFNRAGGATSATVTLLAEAARFAYDSATAIWTIVSNDVPLTQLDARYALKVAVTAVADATTITPALTVDNKTIVQQTNTQAVAGTLTIANPTGSPLDGQVLEFRIKSTNSQTLSFGTSYRGTNQLSLPATTTGGGKWDRYMFEYLAADLKYDFIGVSSGA